MKTLSILTQVCSYLTIPFLVLLSYVASSLEAYHSLFYCEASSDNNKLLRFGLARRFSPSNRNSSLRDSAIFHETNESHPPLFPSTPEWLENPSLLPSHLRGLSSVATSACQRWTRLRNWRYLTNAYNGTKAIEVHSVSFHQKIFQKAGFELVCSLSGDANVDLESLLKFSVLQLGKEWKEESCEECGNKTTMVCRCGAFYCSIACQKKDWEAHKEVCREHKVEHGLEEALSSIYWKLQEELLA